MTYPITRITSCFLFFTLGILPWTFAQSPPRQQQEGASGRYVDVDECVVRFARELSVPSLETGRVAEILVDQNDLVKSDQEIARLDDRSLLIRRSAAQLKAKVARQESSDTNEIDFAELALAEAKEELESSRSISREVRGVIPTSEIRKMRLGVKRAALEVVRAKKHKVRAAVEAESLEAELAIIDDHLRHLHCESPLTGIVLKIARHQGEWIEKGQMIARIGEIDRIHVHALVPSESISQRQCRGLPVSVHWTDESSGKDRSLSGKVLSIDPQLFPGGRYRIHCEIVNQPIGMNSQTHQNGLRTKSRDYSGTGWQLIPGTTVKMRVYLPAISTPQAANKSSWSTHKTTR